jgi:hypothetical protein
LILRQKLARAVVMHLAGQVIHHVIQSGNGRCM